MVRTYRVTVRVRRAGGPPRERAFVVEVLRPAGQSAAPGWRAAVALVLTLVRNERRARQPHPGRPGRTGLPQSPHTRRGGSSRWGGGVEAGSDHLPRVEAQCDLT